MKLPQRLMLVTVLFSFAVTGHSMYASEASAGVADGKLSPRCPSPANWILPNGECVAKGTKKQAGVAAYRASLDSGGKSDSDIHVKAEIHCRTNILRLHGRLHDICYPFAVRLCEDAYIAGATKLAER